MKPIVCIRIRGQKSDNESSRRQFKYFVIPKIALQTANQLLIETIQGTGPTLKRVGGQLGVSAQDLAKRIRDHVPAYLRDNDLEDILRLAFPEAQSA